ncbi:MAG: ATP-binding protein, partial [Sciscionella sp.]
MLHGRVDEMAAVDELLAAARDGRSSVLVIRGEAGIGKTALLDHAAASAGEMRIIRSSGIESESELPFAGLHLLLHQLTDRIDTLPRAQAQALRGALGLASESGSDRFLVGLAVLTLLADLAEERPLLCLVDDAHWLDRASADALLFAARRLEAEGIALFLAARDLHAPPFPAPGLAELQLSSLDGDSASAILMDHASDLPRYVRDQIISEAGGNPLALQELPVAQREGQIPAYAYNLATLPMTKRIQQTFADRISNLPERTQTLLLIAATDDTGDPAVTLKVAERFGSAIEDLEPAEEKRLMRFADGRLTFRHPLIRAAAYQGAPLGLRLTVHRALADVLDGRTNADRRAWHLAAASTGPDEHVATALEESAEHARLRGGYVAVAAAYERAAVLSPDPQQRGRRLTAAARAAADAGQLARAVTLAGQAATHLTDPVAQAQVDRIRATLAREQNRPREAHRILQDAAASIAGSAPDVAGDMFFDSVDAAWTALDFVAVEHTAELAEKLGLRDATQVRVLARVAGGLTLPAAGGVADGVRAVRELLAGGDRVEARARPLALRERAMITRWSLLLGDHAVAHDWAVAIERDCRAQGAIGVLPVALSALAITQLHLGRHHDALATGMEGLRIAEETGQSQSVGYLSDVMAHLAAIQGAEQRCGALVSDAIERGMAPAYHVRAMCAL